MANDRYDVELIRNLFDTLSNSYVVDEITRNEIIKMIETNDFFVPNINGDISENQWHWCHIIWEKCSILSDETIKNKYLKQYNNITFINNDTFHDRFIIIDNNILFTCGASFKDLGKKCFCLSRIEDKEILNSLLKKI